MKVLLENVNDVLGAKYDAFFCSSSFEERCLSIPRHIDIRKISIPFVCVNISGHDLVNQNAKTLIGLLGDDTREISVDMEHPIISADNILEAISNLSLDGKVLRDVLIDITTFSHEILLILFKLILKALPNVKITLVYSNADDYSTNEPVDKKWLSKGVGEIRTVLGYPGKIMPLNETNLIIIVGYEHDRAARIIDALEPDNVYLGYGWTKNATTEKNRDANVHYYNLVHEMEFSYKKINPFNFPCDDIDETISILTQIVTKLEGENIVIAPLNNKLSTIAVGLLAIKHSEIQICYAPALTYNIHNYSSPGSMCHIYQVNNI